MACILKIPTDKSKGVVVFTTQERDNFILGNKGLIKRIESIKNRWRIGLHHNWHDHDFIYNPLFDFSMAGDGDLREKRGRDFKRINLDACNFSPASFSFSNKEKHWDILYVARPVFFKKIPEFFRIIRNLYDKGYFLRVLLICPLIPKGERKIIKSKTVYWNIRKDFERIFTTSERKQFNLLTTDYNDDFPFDLETLSFFYKSSKIFVHSADNERRCRVIGYAHASGMPVVCMTDSASLLPKKDQREPFVFIPKNYDHFAKKIIAALKLFDSKGYNEKLMIDSIKVTSEIYTKDLLKKELNNILSIDGEPALDNESFNFNNLSLRLGRHHGLGHNNNSIGWSLEKFLNYLEKQPREYLKNDIKENDIETFITKYSQFGKISNKINRTINFFYIKSTVVEYFPFVLKLKRFFYHIIRDIKK
ncbi:MAG: hypothetical protein CMC91_03745 [Flavobacteriaceae bacterium]|nr:hypothetical protein [Flavobacteriaceae bacterium]|tara:strand:- start:27271 stop:28530 length:1260 start_codon:yes stop_codon:yes gene_type:complete